MTSDARWRCRRNFKKLQAQNEVLSSKVEKLEEELDMTKRIASLIESNKELQVKNDYLNREKLELQSHNKEGGFAGSKILSINATFESQLESFLEPFVDGARPHLWKLCHRASSDGWASRIFHENCDGKNNTVTVVKVGEYVCGGYTDIPWDVDPSESDGSYGNTSNAFIFSLRNNEGLGPFKSMAKNPSHAIYRSPEYGPAFGEDLVIGDNANLENDSVSDFGSEYFVPSGVQDRQTILAGSIIFTPDEYEVFYLA